MVLAYHLVWTLYGWWLPNDPRGSMSHFVERDVIFELGNLHYGRKKIQPTSREIRAFYERYAEADRLDTDFRLEAARTRELIERFLPPAPATVLDVGGGPCWARSTTSPARTSERGRSPSHGGCCAPDA